MKSNILDIFVCFFHNKLIRKRTVLLIFRVKNRLIEVSQIALDYQANWWQSQKSDLDLGHCISCSFLFSYSHQGKSSMIVSFCRGFQNTVRVACTDSGLVQLQGLATDDPKGFGPTSEVFLEGSMQGPRAGPWLLVCSSWDEQASVATAEPLDYD